MWKSSRVAIAVSLVAALIMVAGGAAIASNAGFKLNKGFVQVNRNWLSLPYFNPYGTQGAVLRDGVTYPNFQGLCDELGMTNLQGSLTELDAVTGGFCQFVCGGGNQCPMVPGKGAEWRDPNLTSAIIVGSHDPTLSLTVPASTGGQVGAFWFAVPYHSTWTDYQAVCDGIGLTQNLGSVIGFNSAADSFTFQWACLGGGGSPALVLGEHIQLRNDVDIAFVPAHF
jgi:hypothetical protein